MLNSPVPRERSHIRSSCRGSNQRRLSRRFYSPLPPAPPHGPDLRKHDRATSVATTLSAICTCAQLPCRQFHVQTRTAPQNRRQQHTSHRFVSNRFSDPHDEVEAVPQSGFRLASAPPCWGQDKLQLPWPDCLRCCQSPIRMGPELLRKRSWWARVRTGPLGRFKFPESN